MCESSLKMDYRYLSLPQSNTEVYYPDLALFNGFDSLYMPLSPIGLNEDKKLDKEIQYEQFNSMELELDASQNFQNSKFDFCRTLRYFCCLSKSY